MLQAVQLVLQPSFLTLAASKAGVLSNRSSEEVFCEGRNTRLRNIKEQNSPNPDTSRCRTLALSMGLCFCYHSILQIVSVWCSGEYWQNFRICCGISICALIVSILIGIGIKSRSWRGGYWQLKWSELSVGLSSRVDWEGKINTSITSRKNCLTGSQKGPGPGVYSQTRCSSDRGDSGFALFLPLVCVPVT